MSCLEERSRFGATYCYNITMVVDFVSDLKYPSPYNFEQAVLGLFVVPVLEPGDGLVEERRGGGVGEADHALHGDGPPVVPQKVPSEGS